VLTKSSRIGSGCTNKSLALFGFLILREGGSLEACTIPLSFVVY
jgi:hypothetical protein